MTPTLYHNPRCSKSRQARALLEEQGLEFNEILYLKAGLTAQDFEAILAKLGGDPLTHLRKGEQAYALLPEGADRQGVAKLLEQHPILLERPVLITDKGALVCRPPERISELV